jgi:hypothetical protein
VSFCALVYMQNPPGRHFAKELHAAGYAGDFSLNCVAKLQEAAHPFRGCAPLTDYNRV